jgi:hypothetical protein
MKGWGVNSSEARLEPLGQSESQMGPRGFRLTDRELEVLIFVLEMKFASVEALYRRFFRSKDSSSNRYAYERLNLLRKHGYLTPIRIHTEAVTYYVATRLARETLQGSFVDRCFVKPPPGIDVRCFEHDKRVLTCRVEREIGGNARDWTSERALKHDWTKATNNLAREFMPDAIFTNRRGERVAFELELSPKTTDRYLRKVQQFAQIVSIPEALFHRVLFVTCSRWVRETLTRLCRPYGDAIFVVPYEEIIGGADGRQNQD